MLSYFRSSIKISRAVAVHDAIAFFQGFSWSWLVVSSHGWPGGVVMVLTLLLEALA